MSDFLDSLATRSLGGGSNLRPRLQPIFDTNPFVPNEPAITTPLARRQSAEEVVHQLRSVTEETVERRVVSETHTTQLTDVTEISTEKSSVTKAIPGPEAPKESHRAEEPVLAKPVVASKPEPQPLQARASSEPSVLVSPPTLTQVLQILPERPATPPSAIVPPPFKSTSAVEARRQESEPKAPDIEIHIGRVEVRAQFAAAAPAKREAPKPKGPAVTLDQYLEGRR